MWQVFFLPTFAFLALVFSAVNDVHTLSFEEIYLDKIVEGLPKYHEMCVKYKSTVL